MKRILKKLVRNANEKVNPEDYRVPIPIFFHEPKKRNVKTVNTSMSFPNLVILEHKDAIKEDLLSRIVPHLKEVATFKVEQGFTSDYKQITVSVDVLEKKEW